MLTQLLASRVFLLASSLALLTVLLTLVFGRAWCGWLCPLGTLLDLFSLILTVASSVVRFAGYRCCCADLNG